MREVRVGRVLAASLHQGIAEVLPARLGFYEHWLQVDRLGEGTVGAARIQAVLSFLRQEGDAYDGVMRCAGREAARWTVAAMSGLRRRAIGALPVFLRRRMLLRIAGRLVRTAWGQSHVSARLEGRAVRVEVGESIFCTVREPVSRPLCLFHAEAYVEILALFDLPARPVIVTCRGMGSPSCTIELRLAGAAEIDGEAAAA
jgi:predicted hydrocarbon binding protein